MKVFQPRVSVRLIKAMPRKEIIPGVASNPRFSALTELDLTPYLGDLGSVHTSKSVHQPAGTFMLLFPDQGAAFGLLAAYIEPMDMIEIRMCSQGELAIVMRGFVSLVEHSESMSGGKPLRMITVSGHDYGKILQMIQIIYLPLAVSDQYFLEWLRWAQQYAGESSVKQKSAIEFVQDVLTEVINPFLSNLALSNKPVGEGNAFISTLSNGVSAEVEGAISTYAPNQFTDVSLYDMLKTLLDAPTFNELFVYDTEEGVTLVVRPTPFKSLQTRTFIQGTAAQITLDYDDIMSQKITRSDESVANYFWVEHHFSNINQMDIKLMALADDKDSFVTFDYLNSLKQKFAIRKMEVTSWLLAPEYEHSDSPDAQQHVKQKTSIENWMHTRRKLLTEMNRDNSILESGSLLVRGNVQIKAGCYLALYNKGNYLAEVYAHTVSHEFKPFTEFTTRVDFVRGTGFFEQLLHGGHGA
jgi:hypothetical protein